jgi:predicted TIM-barrel fold metal-dependent hydrolase
LEEEGIVGEVLFPDIAVGPTYDDFGVPFSNGFAGAAEGANFELLAAGYRAHNRWQAETVDRDRQAGLALISLHDVRAAVKEIEWVATSGLRGIISVGLHPDLPPLDVSCYDRVWSACEDAELPVHFHAGNGGLGATRARGRWSDGRLPSRFDPIRSFEGQYFSQRPLTYLLMSGICHRHPHLRIVFSEMGANWAAHQARLLDEFWRVLGDHAGCPERPSYYFERPVRFGISSPSLGEIVARNEVGIKKLMWGSDHPHALGGWGCTHAWIRSTFGEAKVSEADARLMLGRTCAAFYRLDIKKLEARAAAVGPMPGEVLRPADPGELDETLRSWVQRAA